MDHGWGKGGKLDIARAGSECCQLLFDLPISDHQRHLLNSVSVFLWQSGIYFPKVFLMVGFCLFVCLFESKGEPRAGVQGRNHARKAFSLFFCYNVHGLRARMFEGGEIHRKHGILKG